MGWGAAIGGIISGVGGVASSKGDSKSSDTIPEWARPYYADIANRGRVMADRPYTAYGGTRVAGLSANEGLAGALAAQRASRYGLYAAPSSGSYGGISGGGTTSNFDMPYASFGGLAEIPQPGFDGVNSFSDWYHQTDDNMRGDLDKGNSKEGMHDRDNLSDYLRHWMDPLMIGGNVWNMLEGGRAPDGFYKPGPTSDYWGDQTGQGFQAGGTYLPDGSPVAGGYSGAMGYGGPPGGYLPRDLAESRYATLASMQRLPDANIRSYMNPFAEAALDPTYRKLSQAYETDKRGLADMRVTRGAFGGSRQALLESETQKNFDQATSDLWKTGLAQAYDRAVGARDADLGRTAAAGRSLESLARTNANITQADIDQLMRTGGLDRSLQQAGLDTQYNDFVEARDWQVNQMDPYIRALATLKGQNIPGVNRGAQVAGGLASIAGGIGQLYSNDSPDASGSGFDSSWSPSTNSSGGYIDYGNGSGGGATPSYGGATPSYGGSSTWDMDVGKYNGGGG